MAVIKNKAAEEATVEDAERQASEAEEEPIESAETTEVEAETPEKDVKTPAEAEGELSEADLVGKMTSEQAKAFQAQRLEIKKLKEEKAKKERAGGAFDALKSPTRQVMPEMPKIETFMDAEGRVDVVGYQGAIQRYQETQTYRVQAGQRELRQEMEESVMKMKDPRLDPDSSGYDQNFEARVADRWSRLALEALNKGQQEPTISQAYGEVVEEGVSPKDKEQISKEALEKVSEKEQAASTAEVPSSTPRARETKMVSGFEELRQRTKEGDNEALMARIRAAEEGKE